MAYNEFAYFYDEFNGEADYEALFGYIHAKLQQAGIHLPRSIGQSVSIIGGIVVGTAAVEASLISPGALIVVSLAGICGFALPNRDFAEAIRFFRFVLALTAAGAGLFGLCVGVALLLIHLSRVDSLGVAYLAPFSDPGQLGIVQAGLKSRKYRNPALKTLDRRNQK